MIQARKETATETMNVLSESDSKHCFEQWNIRTERCIDSRGEYIERDKDKNVKEKIKRITSKIPFLSSHTSFSSRQYQSLDPIKNRIILSI